jgi:hypothetical protein
VGVRVGVREMVDDNDSLTDEEREVDTEGEGDGF